MKLKRILAIVLSVAMVLSTMSFNVFAAEPVTTAQEFIDALAVGGTVTLANDIEFTERVSIKVPTGVTIDGNGKTITFAEIYNGAANAAFYGEGEYTIKNVTLNFANDNITVKDSAAAIDMKNGGTAENVTVTGAFVHGVIAGNGAKVTGCTFKNAIGDSSDVYGVYTEANYAGSVIVSDNTFNTPRAAVLTIGAEFKDNTVTGDKGVSVSTSDEITIKGNEFTGKRALSVSKIGETYSIAENNISADTCVEYSVDVNLSNNYWGGNAPSEKQIVAEGEVSATVNGYYTAVDADGNVTGKVTSTEVIVAKVGDAEYSDIQEAIKAAAPDGTVEIIDDIVVDEWVMIAESLSIGGNQLITLDVDGLTINGNGHTLTINSIESAGNGDRMFYDAAELNINDLTIELNNGTNGIGLKSGTLSNVSFIGGGYGVLPQDGEVIIEDCTFKTNNTSIYFEEERDNLTVTGCTFENDEKTNVILLRGNVKFTNNTVVSGRTVNVVEGSPVVTGNDFGDVRLKVYNDAAATIEYNEINVLAFEDTTTVQSTFDANIYSAEAKAALSEAEIELLGVAAINGIAYNDIAAALADAEEGDKIILLGNIYIKDALTIKAGANVTLDLNGATLAGLDTATASFGFINIQSGASLTIEDSSEEKTGAITLKAENNRNWNAYSSVISNQRGKLTVKSGTIEHLGGTDMAYGIDNLTNGKGTYAETIINGGTVKSTYRAIRQFLNGVEAQNIITVNGGTIEGGNKSIWIQDPNKNANTGSITVSENAVLNGDVYLYVTPGSTELPVEVNIAASALSEGYEVTTGNVPEGYEVKAVDGVYGVHAGAVIAVNEEKYSDIQEAMAAAKEGDEITLLADAEGDITLPAGVTFNGNGKSLTGKLTASGDVTFEGDTKVTLFDAGYNKPVITIGKGASLELTGTKRMVIGHGATFNITGEIEDAKTADKASIKPSLTMYGASFTGAGVNFNVKDAYIKATYYCSTKPDVADDTFNFNIENSIWEQENKLEFSVPNGKDPTVNFNLKDSVLNTTSHLVFAVTKGEIVIDNSVINEGNYKQLENRSNMTIKNGSVVYASVQRSSNAKNPGTLTVDNATFISTGEFTGAEVGTGTLIVKNGAKVETGKITKANIVIDATGLSAGEIDMIKADLSAFEGTVDTMVGNALKAEVVDGKIVLSPAAVAAIGENEYMSVQEAYNAAQANDEVKILVSGTYSVPTGKNITVTGAVDGVVFGNIGEVNMGGANVTFNNVTFDYPTNSSYKGLQHSGDLVYNNCTINGQVFLYGKSETFNKCTFNTTDSDNYNVWTYGAKKVEFNECTFNSAGKSVLIYSEDKDLLNEVTVTKSKFNASTAVEGKAAIEMDSSLTAGINLTIDTETTATGFGAGNVSGNSLWNNKKGNSTEENNDITVAVGGETVLQPVHLAKTYSVSTKAELDKALTEASDTDTILLTADIDYGTTQLAINKAIILDLGGFTLTTANGYGGMSLKNNPTIKNGTIKHTGNTAAVKAWNVAAIENVTIDVATYTEGKTKGGIVIQSGTEVRIDSLKDVTIKGKGLTNGIETYNCGNATEDVIGSMENVTIDALGTGMLISAPCGTATNCNIKGGENGIEIWIKGTYSASLDLENCKVDGGVFAHDEFSSNPAIVNDGSLNLVVDENTTGADEKDITLTIARAEKIEGILEEVMENAQAKVGDTYYATVQAAINAAEDGDTVTILPGEYGSINISNKNITIQGTVNDNGELLTTIKGGNPAITGHGFNGTIKDINIIDAWKVMYAEPAGNVTVDNVYVEGATYGFHLVAYSDGLTWIIENSYMDLAWANSLGVHGDGDADIIIRNNRFETSKPYYPDYGALHVNSFLSSLTVENNIFGEGAKIYIDNSVTDTSKVNISKNYHADGVENAFADDKDGITVPIYMYYNEIDSEGNLAGLVDAREAEVNGVVYNTLKEAVEAAEPGQTVELLRDVTEEGSYQIVEGDDITVKGNGHTINCEDGFYVTGGKLTLSEDLSVVASVYNAVYIRGGEVITSANLQSNGIYTAIQGNGSYAGDVTINGGEITVTTAGNAIYWPQNGKLTINGGKIIGKTAVYLKSGALEINGGELVGNGEKRDYAYTVSGATATGDAVVIENVGVNGYEEISSVSIKGGTFTSANAEAVASYAATTENPEIKAVEKFITSGIFSSDVKELLAEGVSISENADGTYGVVAERKLEIEAITENEKANNGEDKVVADEEFTVTVKLTAGENIVNAGWTLNYNPELFELKDYEETTGTIKEIIWKTHTTEGEVFAKDEVIKTYTFVAKAVANEVTDNFTISDTTASTFAESRDNIFVAAVNNEKDDVTIIMKDYEVSATLDGEEINMTAEEPSAEAGFNGVAHTVVVTAKVPEGVNYTVTYTVDDEAVEKVELTDAGEYTVKYTIDAANGYADKSGEIVITINKPDFAVEVTNWTNVGKKLVLVYTDQDNLFFTYDNNLMIDVTERGYEYINENDEAVPYKNVFAFVTEDLIIDELESYKANIKYLADGTGVIKLKLAEPEILADINFSLTLNVQDISVEYGIVNLHNEIYGDVAYQKHLLKGDVNGDKIINGKDTSYVVSEVKTAIGIR